MIFFAGIVKEAVVVSISESRAVKFVLLTGSVLEVDAKEATVDVEAAGEVVSVLENCVLMPELDSTINVEGVVTRSKNASVVFSESFSLCSFSSLN